MDLLGLFGSALCVVHCSALPIMLSLGMLNGFQWMDSHLVEFIFLAMAVIIAFWTIVRSYFIHRNLSAIIIAILGFTIFLLGVSQHNHSEIGLTTLGGIFIAISHIVNWKLTHNKAHISNSVAQVSFFITLSIIKYIVLLIDYQAVKFQAIIFQVLI